LWELGMRRASATESHSREPEPSFQKSIAKPVKCFFGPDRGHG